MSVFQKVNRKIVLNYIEKRCRKSDICLPTDINSVLDGYESLSFLGEDRLCFLCFKSNSGIDISRTNNDIIIANSEWAAQLVLHNGCHTVTNAFLISVGHEIGHRLDYKVTSVRGYRNQKFVSWCNEVHHDFYGATVAANSSRQELLSSTRFKCEQKPWNSDSFSCPSWLRRLYYETYYDFNEKLIRKIAKDAKCRNENTIQKIISHYTPISLN